MKRGARPGASRYRGASVNTARPGVATALHHRLRGGKQHRRWAWFTSLHHDPGPGRPEDRVGVEATGLWGDERPSATATGTRKGGEGEP